MNINEETATTTPVVEEETTPVVETESPVVESTPTPSEPVSTTPVVDNGGYVKQRVDRAKTQATEKVLNELGVKSVDDAKQLIANGTKALEEVAKLREELDTQKYENEIRIKRSELAKILDNEKVFDTDALLNYVDFDKVKLEDGKLQDTENIVASLKKAKPNFFGNYEVVSDGYVKGQPAKPQTALDKQKSGNITGAIDDYLKTILK